MSTNNASKRVPISTDRVDFRSLEIGECFEGRYLEERIVGTDGRKVFILEPASSLDSRFGLWGDAALVRAFAQLRPGDLVEISRLEDEPGPRPATVEHRYQVYRIEG